MFVRLVLHVGHYSIHCWQFVWKRVMKDVRRTSFGRGIARLALPWHANLAPELTRERKSYWFNPTSRPAPSRNLMRRLGALMALCFSTRSDTIARNHLLSFQASSGNRGSPLAVAGVCSRLSCVTGTTNVVGRAPRLATWHPWACAWPLTSDS